MERAEIVSRPNVLLLETLGLTGRDVVESEKRSTTSNLFSKTGHRSSGWIGRHSGQHLGASSGPGGERRRRVPRGNDQATGSIS